MGESPKPAASPEEGRYRLLAFVDGETLSKTKDQMEDEVHVFPFLVYKELLCVLVVSIGLLIWSLLANAPLREMANLTLTENPAKAPWYFVGLQELLVYFDPWIAGVVLPGLIILGLMVIPYIDRNPKASGGYTFRPRRFAIINYVFGFAMWWVLIFIGQFFRGPNWQFYWPWESWAVHKPIEEALWNMPAIWGAILIAVYYGIGFALPYIWRSQFVKELGRVRYGITMFFVLTMYAVPLKILVRLVLHIRYVLVTPWFNI